MRMVSRRTQQAGLSRREFIRLAGLSALGAPLFLHGGPLWSQEEGPAGPTLPRVPMGRLSQVRVARLIGNETMPTPVFERALELGVNYWHKFGNRRHFDLIRQAGRDQHYIELCLDPKGSVEEICERFKRRLQRIGAEYADFYKSHISYPPKVLEVYRRLKEEGLVRYLSASIHGWRPTREAIEQADLHQVQVAFNALAGPQVWEIVKRAQEKGVAVIAMKTMLGGPGKWAQRKDLKERLAPYLPDDGSIARALIKGVLSHPGVTGVVVVCATVGHLEENARAASEPLTEAEARGLDILTAALTDQICRMCGACAEACPRGVATSDIIRYEMYATGYGEWDRARRLYRELPPERRAEGCDGCGLCEQACPYGLKVAARIAQAHRLLA